MIKNELKAQLESGAPIIVIGSWEEDCVEALVREIAAELQRPVIVWSASHGFAGDEKAGAKTSSPHEALERISRAAKGSIALLKDFHPYFNDPVCVRAAREIAQNSRDTAIVLILTMPAPNVPVELEREASFLTYPLPDAAELKGIFESLTASKSKAGALSERAAVAAAGLTRKQAAQVFRLATAADKNSEDDILHSILTEKRSLTRGALALEFRRSAETFEVVGGLGELKKWLMSRAGAFSEKARSFGLPAPKGLLLLGIQGCGKSLTAKAVSEFWKLPLLRLDLSRIDPVSGEEMLMQALRTAEAVSPAVLWIDEIEKGFGKAGGALSGVSLRALSAFVTWLQEKAAPVYVVATANSISQMPPELLRKGRFDEIFFINLPSPEERAEILRIHLAKRGRNPDTYDVEALAKKSEGFSGAEIEAAIVAGMFDAFAAGRELKTEDILDAIQTTVPLSTTMEDEVKAIRDWAKGRSRPATLDTRLADLLKPQRK